MKTQLQIMNKKLGWIPPSKKIIDGKQYSLFDSLYSKSRQQIFDLENRAMVHIKSRNYKYRIIRRKDTLAIYMR